MKKINGMCSKEEMMKMITPEIVDAAESVCAAMALVQTVRPIVEKYSREILKKHQFKNLLDKKILEEHGKSDKYVEKVVLDPKHTYLLSDEDAAVWERERREACAKSGLKVESPEYCPLLVAENLQRKAERVLLDSMKPITSFGYDDVPFENTKKAVEVEIGLIASLGLLNGYRYQQFAKKLLNPPIA